MMQNKKIFLTALCLAASVLAKSQILGYGIIVGENVRLRSDSTINSQILKVFNTGEYIQIEEATTLRAKININNDICDDYGYHWYKIISKTGEQGWVFGAFVYIIEQENNNLNNDFEINEKYLQLKIAVSQTYGPADEYGLTGCDLYSIPFFKNEKNEEVYPIKLNVVNTETNPLNTSRNNWLMLSSGEGGADYISDITLENGFMKMTIKRSFQEGGATATLFLYLKENYFEAILEEYQMNY